MLPYDPCDTREMLTTFGPKQSTIALRDITRLVLNLRGFHLGDDGIYNRRPQRGTSSTWSLHSGGRAWDCAISPAFMKEGDFVAQLFVDKADMIGVCEVIWNRHRWHLKDGVVVKEVYSGVDPHVSHVHVSQTEAWVDKKNSRELWLGWYKHMLFGL